MMLALSRQRFFIALLSLVVCLSCSAIEAQAATDQAITVTDITGKTVTLKAPAKRIVLAQGRLFQVLALLHPDPASLVVGWSDEFKKSYNKEYNEYIQKSPQLKDVTVIAKHLPSTFSVEQTLVLQPDLVVMTAAFAGIRDLQHPQSSSLISQLQKAGILVIVIDFFDQPLKNTVTSLKALGYAIGSKERTDDFIAFYQQHMATIAERNKDVSKRPLVLMDAHAGMNGCCNSPGLGTFNDMITFAGGHNIGSDVITGATGKLNYEYINSRNPDVYIATGTGATQRVATGLAIGYKTNKADAEASLAKVIKEEGLTTLQAATTGNAHGIWHAFNDSPLHMIFIEALAKWIAPEKFKDIDPQATLDEVNKRFLTIPMDGTYLVNLPAPK